ncbi:putative DEAD/DEAH box DNA helicase (Mer3) [Aspergillus undulatus]|uniref:putative DEAD/DEAH box DNA helicase (Mer3) n=1 Tax=Aspergillus undulatus TaxID=1810928 RepID=UPI003CCE0523
MRRRVDRPFIIPRRQGTSTTSSPSWNRSGQSKSGFPASSQSQPHPDHNGFIDEKLIEGSQVSSSSYFSQFQRQEPQYQSFESYPAATQFHQSRLPVQMPREEAFGDEDGDIHFDSFGEIYPCLLQYLQRISPGSRRMPSPQATPHRSIPSSSSDNDIRDANASSPLARLQPGRPGGLFRGHDFETQSSITQAFHYQPQSSTTSPSCHNEQDQDTNTPFPKIPVSVKGIVLLSVRELPEIHRILFPFSVFNAIQSKCFDSVYKSNDNVVLAAPTGSGKTVVMELAICRLLDELKDEQFKVVYQAPTKSLCSERFRDWSRKFQVLGLQCAELTGDTDHTSLRNVQHSQIIITTPEKWDSMTRKWKDHVRLMQLVKLFLIDEVHTLKEARGATLEAVVSRMKTIGSNVRFVALSATIPNSEDIATWLGRNAASQHVPAQREHFGEEFRPVKLQKFVYGHQSSGNNFAFDKLLNSKLADAIRTHSAKRPIMIFCCTRNSAVTTAKELAKLWSVSSNQARLWKGPNKPMPVTNADLKTTTVAGVAFHHAGLEPADRHQVENGYLEGKISIICCTSTLAVGVNLPCHLVIIKNTVGWQEGCCQEYSDLEVMQMLGRAGRPQFDDSAVAVILTRKERVNHYERLVSGSESLESCLHLNLIDHLNAEIGLGNVTSIESATAWLAGTFLFVRLRRNPTHYKLKEGANRDDENEMLQQICEKDIKLLQECDLVKSDALKTTPLGDAMARYYIRFETMKALRSMKSQSDVSQILSILSQADEFRDIRLKAGERSVYRELNRSADIKYPINVDIALPAHKISLLIQSELGAVEFPSAEQFQKHRFTFQQDKSFVFSHVNRVIRCIIDCQVHLQDSVATRNALELARSLAARVWDDSPLQMKQIEQIGVVAVRKLVGAGIESIEALEETAREPHVIDMVLSKNPPFGMKLRARLAEFPKLRVSVKMAGKETNLGRLPRVRFKAEIAFMNEKCPALFQKRPVYVCFVAETSDGRLIDFRRMSANKLQNSHEIFLSADLKAYDQFIACHVMCDETAGTSRSAVLRPDLPRSYFPGQAETSDSTSIQEINKNEEVEAGSISDDKPADKTRKKKIEDYDTDDLLPTSRSKGNEWHTKAQSNDSTEPPVINTKPPAKASKTDGTKPNTVTKGNDAASAEPERLDNGRWACNHKCKDKTSCKHFCCREGLDNPPKVAKRKPEAGSREETGSNQLKLSANITKPSSKNHVPTSTNKASKQKPKNKHGLSSSTWALVQQLPGSGSQSKSASTDNPISLTDSSSDYGDESFDGFPSPLAELFGNNDGPLDHVSQKKNVATADQCALVLGDGLVDDGDVLFPMHSPDEEPFAMNDGSAKTCPVDLISPEPQNKFPVNSHIGNCGGQKRKSTDEGRTYALYENNNGINKRAKCYESTKNLEDKVPSEEQKQCEENRKVDGLVAPLVVDGSLPTDWEGIDPALLDDFKDIVDFF